jgi:hypothetical protein
MTLALWIAGGLQLLVASSNVFAPRKLRYAENLARVDRTFRDVFVILYLYIILMLVSFAVLCFTFAGELAGGSALGRCLSGFLAGFWGLRTLMQVFHYNREIKRRYPVYNALFMTTFVILTAIFATAALR